MRFRAIIVLLAFTLTFLVTACDNNTVDMKKFKDTMQKESTISPETKKEIRKSIFPNMKGE